MPTYNFRHNETGEEQEIVMKIRELDQWKVDNPQWSQFHQSAPNFGYAIGGDMISKTPDGFTDLLKSIKKGSGRGNTITTKN